MKTITVRDLRQRWPETEKRLQMENEIVITRHGRPVANLVRILEAASKRPRWNMAEHARWQKKLSGGKVSRSDAALALSRADRACSNCCGKNRKAPLSGGLWTQRTKSSSRR